jgi:RimJ/RimL family protein N-acetyltransferase
VLLRLKLPLYSERVSLRPLVPEDAEALLAYRSVPAVCRYLPFEPMDLAEVMKRMEDRWSRRDIDADGQTIGLGIELRSTGQLIGDVMVRAASLEHRNAEFGYVLNPAFEGRGFATEAAHRVLHLAFDDFGFHRVMARIAGENDSSVGVVRRLRLRQEAHFIQNEWFKGRWSDELEYAMLDHEWHALHDNGAAESGCPVD